MTFKLVSPAFLDVVEEFFTNSRTLNVLSCLLSALSTFLGKAAFVDARVLVMKVLSDVFMKGSLARNGGSGKATWFS